MSEGIGPRRSIAPPGAGTGPSAPGGDWLVEEDESTRKANLAKARLATDVAIGIERTLKSFRQFGVRHKTSLQFVDDAVKRLAAFAAEHGELALSVIGSDILFDGDSIYSDPELRTSYPFLLFRDGVQRVIFEPGVEQQEVVSFCTILRDQTLLGSNVALEDDLVTLLWDADLAHLRYVVSESFKQDEADPEQEAKRERLVGQIRDDALAPALPADLSARFVRPPKEREMDRASRDLDVARAWERGNEIANDQQARAALVAQVDTDDTLLRKFLEIVFVEILSHRDPKVRGDLVKLVRDFAIEATRRDRLAEAIGVLKALGDLAKSAGNEGRRVAQEILAAIATPEFLAEVMNQLGIADEAGTEQLLTFLALIPPKESRALVPHLSSVGLSSRRRAVCQLLADRLGDDLAQIGEQIRDAEEGLALDLVYLLKQSPSARARVELLVALDHLAPSVRRAAYDAIRTGARPEDPTVVGASLLALEDQDEELRRVGLMSLPRAVDAEVARRLRTVISREAFDGWDYSDKRRAFLAYACASGKRAAKELVEVLGARAMFSSDDLEDRRCSAAFALAALGDEGHMPVLETEAKRMFGGKRLKEACEAAMSILKFKRPIEAESASVALAPQDDIDVLPTAHLPKPIWDEAATTATAVGAPAVGSRAPAPAPQRPPPPRRAP
ncbi:MAG: hypothetical protein HYV09_07765 [Deltaproteobacteria bacterium]|nr:hypothetical protein [Deltaproteobacteria bacterium]